MDKKEIKGCPTQVYLVVQGTFACILQPVLVVYIL